MLSHSQRYPHVPTHRRAACVCHRWHCNIHCRWTDKMSNISEMLKIKPSFHAYSYTLMSGSICRALGLTNRAISQFQSHIHMLHAIAWLLSIWIEGRHMELFTLENLIWPTCFIVLIKASFYPLSHPFDLSLSLFLSAGLPALVVAVSVGFTRARGYGTAS